MSKGSSCAPALRKLCAADSPAQTRVLNYAFSPGGCHTKPEALTEPVQDIANFLLVRGPQAFLGHGWLGCSREYEVPEQLNWVQGLRHRLGPRLAYSFALYHHLTRGAPCSAWWLYRWNAEWRLRSDVMSDSHFQDFGEPTEVCKETAANSGVFTREWTKASISMDCNTWTPTIKMK